MNPLIWKSEYSLGNDLVDAQHIQIFEIYNKICESPPESIDQSRLLDELVGFTVEHFAEEEMLMARANYQPSLFEHHKSSHAQILQTLLELRANSVDEMLEFFGVWIVDHMLIEDRRLQESLGSVNKS